MNYLVMTNKGNSRSDRPEAILIVVARLTGVGIHLNQKDQLKTLEFATVTYGF